MTDPKRLQQIVFEWCGKKEFDKTEVPAFITDNLNPKFSIRPYQKTGLQYFLNYWNEAFEGKPRQNHQLLFHMATGSGKTMMMAGIIIYLYSKGYRNFLFFVNSTNIINKTRDNFLNEGSRKYLYSDQISIGEKRINIKEVDSFQSVNTDDINIVFSTIQGLHMTLNNPKENGLTYDDFEDKKIVLISDEAHHINAETKKGKDVDQDEMFEAISWEGTVTKIFNSNPANCLLEFTATVDFNDETLAAKYLPKLIYDYPLSQFRIDGYSKEIKVLQASLEPFERAVQAVILSQYRRKVFEKYGKAIKPVLLFKSKTIKESLAFFTQFKDGIKSLTPAVLTKIQTTSKDQSVSNAFAFFAKNNISFTNLITELQIDFEEDKLISVNSKEESEAKQIAVNSLESNEYRAVFAVDKLNEGWDVLNLFDIVRLYDTRDNTGKKIGKTTMSEAQLIGRGARYCPFQINADQPLFGRKYDSDIENELRICEELYYHSSYNPKYIQDLNTALRELGLKPKNSVERKVTIKDSFKKTTLFKVGHIFLNEREKNERKDIVGLPTSMIPTPYPHQLHTGYTKTTTAFEGDKNKDKGEERKAKDYSLSSFGSAVVRKAIQRLEFYEFSNLRDFLPNLKSVDEFITSDKYLGKLSIEFSGSEAQILNPSVEDKLEATIRLLDFVSKVISSEKIEFKGSKEFKPKMVNEVFKEKVLNFTVDEGTDQEFGKSMCDPTETAYHLDLSTRDWFAFTDCYGTSEEKLLIKFIDKRYAELALIYSEVFLIRNEKHFKIYGYDDGKPLEPDFVLFLVGKEPINTMHYQVFLEPKGSHLLRADKWKEDFLVSIKANHTIEQLFSNKQYVVWGMPFYNYAERMPEFEAGFKELLPTE
jgi:type III restriction enzyme